MAVIPVSLAIPDLRIPRSYPCSAVVDWDTECGATPASLYRRSCGVVEHTREVWLCPVHVTMVAASMAICRECARRGGMRNVLLFRMTEPIRL